MSEAALVAFVSVARRFIVGRVMDWHAPLREKPSKPPTVYDSFILSIAAIDVPSA